MQTSNHEMHTVLGKKRNPMNKTWLAMEVQYFRFIGQIPPAIVLNTIPVIHLNQWVEEGRALVNLISGKNQSQGQDTPSFFSPHGGVREYCRVKKQAGSFALLKPRRRQVFPGKRAEGRENNPVQFQASVEHTWPESSSS